MGDGTAFGLFPEEIFLSFAKVCPPFCVMWSLAVHLLVNSEISVVCTQLGCKVRSASP